MNHLAALKHLKKDHHLSPVIDKFVIPPLLPSADLYQNLLESIVSQQLSVKAADTIFKRFLALFPGENFPKPEEVLKISDDTLRSCGLSRQKASYLKSLSELILSGQLILEDLESLPDEEVILLLTKVKGIGRWTAEMFLIFTLGRPDIFSLGDLGLRTAVSRLYGVDRDNLKAIEDISLQWQPVRSLASRYLWKSLDNAG